MSLSIGRRIPSGSRTAGLGRDASGPAVGLLPGRVVAYAWLVAGLPIAALQLAHAGVHERNELPPLLHWLRDTALAVPVAALAVIVAALVVMRVRGAGTGERASLAAATSLGFLAAAMFAVLAVPLAQVHGALFGADAETGMTPLQHALTEAVSVFQVALLLVPVTLLAGVPWRDSRSGAADLATTAGMAGPHPRSASADPVLAPAAGRALEGADR